MIKGTGGFLHPEEIIGQLNIGKEIVIADFGCGAGYFTIPLAKIVEQGKVYALDILDTSLESVRSRARLEGLFNIETKHCNLEANKGSGLGEGSVDLVLLANILFQSLKKTDIIKEAGRVLKKGGLIAIIDWKVNQPMGPPENLIVSLDSVKEITGKQGLFFKKEFPVDKYHWGMVFEKS
jgi:ubiquinone/menaquinone biosynthesis C-methylase UbiE